MKLTPDCVHCLLRKVLFQARLLENGCETEAVGAALQAFAREYDSDRNSAEVATEVHRAAYGVMKADPYYDMKLESDRIAEKYLPEVERFIDSSEDPFRAAVMVAVIGNIMDFGTPLAIDSPDKFDSVFRGLLAQGIGSDQTDEFVSLLKDAENVMYFFDNCGESQFDKLLIRRIRAMGKRVVGVVRGEAILNDVTYEDAVRIGMDKAVDRLVSTGAFMIGVNLKLAGGELKEEIKKADLIVAKGMANYESMSDQDFGVPKVHILRTKCSSVARSLGVPENINVVRILS